MGGWISLIPWYRMGVGFRKSMGFIANHFAGSNWLLSTTVGILVIPVVFDDVAVVIFVFFVVVAAVAVVGLVNVCY